MAVEIERKYIIEKPWGEYISTLEGYTSSYIIQTYLVSSGTSSERVRRREFDGKVVFTHTRKVRLDGMSAMEDECEITQEEYEELLKRMDTALKPIEKIRYTFNHDGKVYEIDVYPEWERTAVMEVELSDRFESVNIPSFIKVVKEVTGDRRYSNHAMAKAFPKEVR